MRPMRRSGGWPVMVALLFLSASIFAQPALTATGTVAPPAVTLSVTGATPNSPVMLAASLQPGTTTMHGITLGIATPWIFVYMGATDPAGSLNQTYALNPAAVPPPLAGTTVYVQGGVITMTGMTGGGMTGGGMTGGGMTGGGMMGGGMMAPGPGMGGSTMTMGGMTITLTNVANFTF